MTVDEIFAEWEEDSEIKINDLDRESLRIPKLHGKYYRYLVNERMKLRALEADLARLKKLKNEYYNGSLDTETMNERGWKPFKLKPLKTDIPAYIEADEEMIQMNLRISVYNEKISLLDSIIRIIGNRGFQIKSAIDFMKFKNGEF